jgi:signal transduction histidine kinase
MGGHGLPGRERRRATRRSIWFTFAVITAVPLVAVLAVWGFAGATLGDATAHGGQAALHGAVLVRVVVAAGIGLLAVLVAAVILGRFARQISRDVVGLEASARRFADQQMPRIIDRLRGGEEFDPYAELPPLPGTKITELGRVAAALASVQRTAVTAAAAETSMRSGISQVFVSLARRSQSLLQRQLRLIDELERKAVDPSALADLFPLDHLTTRMRRHAEGLIILSGAVPGRGWSSPVPVIDVVRGAIAEVEDYQRVRVASTTEGMMAGSAVADMIHLLAELVENATLFSPSGTQVQVRAERTASGFTFEIEDRGLGIKPDDLDAINERLSSQPDFDLADADRLGLFVVGKLAARHDARVFLRPSPYGGTTAVVITPPGLVGREASTPAAAPQAQPESARLPEDMQLALTGQFRREKPAVAAPAAPLGPATGPTASLPRRRAAVPGRPDSVPLTDTHQGLPRRVRQASLSPHLRNGTSSDDAGPRPQPEARSPEQARDLLASMQRGWERGRQTTPSERATDEGGTEDEAAHQEG